MPAISVNKDRLFVFVVAAASCLLMPLSFWGDLKWVALENFELVPFIPLSVHRIMVPIIQSIGFGLLLSLLYSQGRRLPLFLFFILSHNTLGLHQFNLLFAIITFVAFIRYKIIFFAGLSSVFHPSTGLYVIYELIKDYGLLAIIVLIGLLYAIMSSDVFSVLERLQMFQNAFNGQMDLSYKVSTFSARGLMHWTVLISIYLMLVRSTYILIAIWLVYGGALILSDYLHPVLLERNLQLLYYMVLIYSMFREKPRISISIRLIIMGLYSSYFIYYVMSAY